MKLEKSPKSAVLLSAIAVGCFTITDAILNLLIPYIKTGDIRSVVADPSSLHDPITAVSFIIFLGLVLVVLIAIGAFWLFRFFGSKYYGERSGYRWGLFGLFFAILLIIPEWLLPDGWRIARLVLQAASLFGAFFLSRWIIPFNKN